MGTIDGRSGKQPERPNKRGDTEMGLNIWQRLFPGRALRRELQRRELTRLYDAAKTSNYHKPVDASRSGDGVMDHAGARCAHWPGTMTKTTIWR